jgi:hypothetical protein
LFDNYEEDYHKILSEHPEEPISSTQRQGKKNEKKGKNTGEEQRQQSRQKEKKQQERRRQHQRTEAKKTENEQTNKDNHNKIDN